MEDKRIERNRGGEKEMTRLTIDEQWKKRDEERKTRGTDKTI